MIDQTPPANAIAVYDFREPWQTSIVLALAENDGPDYAMLDALIEADCPVELARALITIPVVATVTRVWSIPCSAPYSNLRCVECWPLFAWIFWISDGKHILVDDHHFRIPPAYGLHANRKQQKIILNWLYPHFVTLIQLYQKPFRSPNVLDNKPN